MTDEIRTILDTHGRLATPAAQLSDDADLFDAGLDSIGMVNVMLALEAAFDLEFPEALLVRASFQSVGNLRGVIGRLRDAG